MLSCSKVPEGSSAVKTNVSFQTADTLYYPHIKLVNLETGKNYIQRIDPRTMETYVTFGNWDIYFLASLRPITNQEEVTSAQLICGASFGNNLFEEESVYVGLTGNYSRRYNSHHTDKDSSVYQAIQSGHEYTYYEQNEWYTPEIAGQKEEEWISWYESSGWEILNKVKAGSIGGNNLVYTKESCLEIAKKYQTRRELKDAEPKIYEACKRKKITKEAFSHMVPASRIRKWTREECIRVAKKAKAYMNFKMKYNSAYNATLRNQWLDIIGSLELSHKPKGHWKVKENCHKEALKYKSKSDFKKGSPGAYRGAIKFGYFEEVTSHMPKRARPKSN